MAAATAMNSRIGTVCGRMSTVVAPLSITARTIDYVGLERATGVKKDDLRSDLFFAGCIFYHILTGVPPL